MGNLSLYVGGHVCCFLQGHPILCIFNRHTHDICEAQSYPDLPTICRTAFLTDSATFARVNGKNLTGQIGQLAEFELYQRCCLGSVDLVPHCRELHTLLPASQ